MRRICTVLKVIFGSIAGLGLLGICCVNDASDNWFQTIIISFLISIISFLLALLFGRLSRIKITLPDWMVYVMATIFEIFSRVTKKSSHNTHKHRYKQSIPTKIVNISDYLPNDEQCF